MRVHIAADHAAFDLKAYLVRELELRGHELIDHGARSYDPADDYPVHVFPCAEAVAADPEAVGFVLGGSGNGEQIAANKVPGIRAALACSPLMARQAREHLDANVLALGGRLQTLDAGLELALAFLETPFTEDPRHERRLQMISDYEAARGSGRGGD